MQRMQKSEAGRGQEVTSPGARVENKQRGLGRRGSFEWSFDRQAAGRRALGRWHPWGDGLGEVMTAGWLGAGWGWRGGGVGRNSFLMVTRFRSLLIR